MTEEELVPPKPEEPAASARMMGSSLCLRRWAVWPVIHSPLGRLAQGRRPAPAGVPAPSSSVLSGLNARASRCALVAHD